MKVCDYCGKRNEDTTEFCESCGTCLKATEEAKTEPLKSSSRTLDARSATTILLAYLAMVVLCASVFAVIAIATTEAQGIHDYKQTTLVLNKLTPVMAVLIPILGGAVTVAMSFALIPKHLKDTSPNGAAWVLGHWWAIGQGLVIGLIVGACVYALNMALRSHVAFKDMGPLQRMWVTPGLAQKLFVISAVVLAPPFEELLFRGVLYGGYRKTFGPIWAAVSTTLIFVLLHVPQTIHYLPGIASITVAALAALWCRLRSNAIGPAIAVHVGYNTMLVFFVMFHFSEKISTLANQNQAISAGSRNTSVYDSRGRAYGMKGDLDKAISEFDHAIQLNPEDALAFGLRGKAYLEKKELDKAIADLSKAILLDPKDALAYANRGRTYYKKSEFQRAINDLEEAVRLDPKNGLACNGLAWMLATCPDPSIRNGKKAVATAQKACELEEWKAWYCVGTLAAAYAEVGDFEQAVKCEKQAMSMSGLTDTNRAEAQQQLELYQQRKPYHELPKQ
jgi:tetratricopeptide (TPR) repeat protein